MDDFIRVQKNVIFMFAMVLKADIIAVNKKNT